MKIFSKRRAVWALGCLSGICVMAPPALAGDHGYKHFTPITDCGTVISEPGYYKLVNDLTDCDVQDPLEGRDITYAVGINSSNVTLDLDGHTISCVFGPLFSFGIYTEAYQSGITIANGTVTNCGLGAILNQSKVSIVKYMKLTGNIIGAEVLAVQPRRDAPLPVVQVLMVSRPSLRAVRPAACAEGGKEPVRFANKKDRTYQDLLAWIAEGSQVLRAQPRMDMPGAVAASYEQDFGHLYHGGGK